MKKALAIQAVTVVFCMMPIFAAAQEQPSLTDKQKRAIAEETAKLKAAGPQRDRDDDAAYYAKVQAEGRARAAAAMQAALAKPTPHTADGKPDLNGIWITGAGFTFPAIISADGKTRKVLFRPRDDDATVRDVVPPMGPNQPSYKAEYQAKVNANWFDQNHTDPTAFNCRAPGVPRMGEPSQIIQTPGQVVLLYHQEPKFRVIYTDGRAHRTDVDPSAQGDSVGHWEGDTLVIDVTLLTDDTWLSSYGTLHSDETHVIERLTRKGDALSYSATVEDPKVLTKPWTTGTVARVLGGKDDALENDFPCVDTVIDGVPDSAHVTGLIHH